MLEKLKIEDIPHVVEIHRSELHGFLSDLGEGFLTKFYEVSLDIPEIFTLVEVENEQILGFVTATTRVKGLYKKVIFKNPFVFAVLFLSNFITHPINIVKSVKSLIYPGFADDIPELLTIAVKKEYQNKGIGTKLFTETAKEFQRRGFRKFQVSTYETLSANSFYKKMGCKYERSFDFLDKKMKSYICKLE